MNIICIIMGPQNNWVLVTIIISIIIAHNLWDPKIIGYSFLLLRYITDKKIYRDHSDHSDTDYSDQYPIILGSHNS